MLRKFDEYSDLSDPIEDRGVPADVMGSWMTGQDFVRLSCTPNENRIGSLGPRPQHNNCFNHDRKAAGSASTCSRFCHGVFCEPQKLLGMSDPTESLSRWQARRTLEGGGSVVVRPASSRGWMMGSLQAHAGKYTSCLEDLDVQTRYHRIQLYECRTGTAGPRQQGYPTGGGHPGRDGISPFPAAARILSPADPRMLIGYQPRMTAC